MRHTRPATHRIQAIPLILFWISAGVYVLNIVLAKITASIFGVVFSFQLGDTAQFLLLLAIAILLVTAALLREARLDDDP